MYTLKYSPEINSTDITFSSRWFDPLSLDLSFLITLYSMKLAPFSIMFVHSEIHRKIGDLGVSDVVKGSSRPTAHALIFIHFGRSTLDPNSSLLHNTQSNSICMTHNHHDSSKNPLAKTVWCSDSTSSQQLGSPLGSLRLGWRTCPHRRTSTLICVAWNRACLILPWRERPRFECRVPSYDDFFVSALPRFITK